MPNKPLRVMYFIGEYARFAGSQKIILNIARHLPKEEVHPIAVFPGEGRCPEIFRKAGVETHVIEAPAELNVFGKQLLRVSAARKAWLLARSVAPYNAKLAAFMKEAGVDVVHFSTARGLLLGFLAPRRLGKPVVLHIQGVIKALGPLLSWIAGFLPDRLILLSEGLRGQIPEYFRYKCAVLPPCRVPSEDAAGLIRAAPQGGAPEQTTVLIASSLVPFKGYHHLLRAIAALNQARGPQAPRVAFVGIGEAPDLEYSAYIAALQRELGVDNFIHKGWQASPGAFFRDAEIIVLPSIEQETLTINGRPRLVLGNEGFGLVLLEAMALGKPVVASRVTGPPDIVENEVDGFLVPPGDPAALAEALRRLIDDPGLRERLGAAARRKAESDRFSPQGTSRTLVALYRELV